MVDIKTILASVIEHGASDLHINVGMPPVLRSNTELIDLDFPPITEEDAKEMVLSMVGTEKFEKLEKNKDFDFSTKIDDGHRFRVNAHYQRDTIAISFRVIPNVIPDIDDLHLPPIVKELTDLPRGLVLVTGHTGSGKSTSLAAMIELINTKYRKRIVTLEDPIEYMIDNRISMIEQREIGSDCPGFASGLKHVLRQDPDIIMVGEMRDHPGRSQPVRPERASLGALDRFAEPFRARSPQQDRERTIEHPCSHDRRGVRIELKGSLEGRCAAPQRKRVMASAHDA